MHTRVWYRDSFLTESAYIFRNWYLIKATCCMLLSWGFDVILQLGKVVCDKNEVYNCVYKEMNKQVNNKKFIKHTPHLQENGYYTRNNEWASHLHHLSKIWIPFIWCWNNQLRDEKHIELTSYLSHYLIYPWTTSKSQIIFIFWEYKSSNFLHSFSQTSITCGGGKKGKKY